MSRKKQIGRFFVFLFLSVGAKTKKTDNGCPTETNKTLNLVPLSVSGEGEGSGVRKLKLVV